MCRLECRSERPVGLDDFDLQLAPNGSLPIPKDFGEAIDRGKAEDEVWVNPGQQVNNVLMYVWQWQRWLIQSDQATENGLVVHDAVSEFVTGLDPHMNIFEDDGLMRWQARWDMGKCRFVQRRAVAPPKVVIGIAKQGRPESEHKLGNDFPRGWRLLVSFRQHRPLIVDFVHFCLFKDALEPIRSSCMRGHGRVDCIAKADLDCRKTLHEGFG